MELCFLIKSACQPRITFEFYNAYSINYLLSVKRRKSVTRGYISVNITILHCVPIELILSCFSNKSVSFDNT